MVRSGIAAALCSVVTVLSPLLPAAPPVRGFRIDAGHSDVAFSIGFLGHPVRGRFSDIRGTIAWVRDKPAASGVTVVIGVSSINTGSEHRDEHLRSAEFFDAARYPVIVFRSRRITANGGTLVATGALTVHGITRDIAIPFVETSPPIEDPHGSTLLVYSGAVRIARKDFGIVGGSKYNSWFDSIRSATMADSVDITLDVTGWDSDLARIRTYDATVATLEKEGIGPTVTRLHALHAANPKALDGAEWEMEQVARVMLFRGHAPDAIVLFKMSTEFFPGSSAAFAALAHAYEVAGDLPSARTSTAQALAIDSLDPRALELSRRVGQ